MLNSNYLDEQQLTLRLIEGDEHAFVEIYRRNWRIMFNTAYKRLGDEKLCEDIIQNIFTDLWERRQMVSIHNISAYLLTAVRFQVIKHSTRAHITVPLIERFENIFVSPFKTEDNLLDTEITEILMAWIDALPEKRREVFIMHYMEGRTTSEIAASLGITQKTVQNQIASASATIKEQLSKTMHFILPLVISIGKF